MGGNCSGGGKNNLKAAEQTQGNYHSDTAQAKRPLLLEKRADWAGRRGLTLLSGVKIQCSRPDRKAGRDRKCPPDNWTELRSHVFQLGSGNEKHWIGVRENSGCISPRKPLALLWHFWYYLSKVPALADRTSCASSHHQWPQPLGSGNTIFYDFPSGLIWAVTCTISNLSFSDRPSTV